jgi:hypothetical protein
MDEIFISRGTSGPLTPFTHSPPLSLEWRTRRKERWTRMRKWRRRRDEKSREERAARSAQDQGHELHHLHHLMFSSRALSSYFLELNPQTLTQVSLHAWMDHELWKLLYHPKSKIKSCYNSILSCFLQSLSLMNLWNFCKNCQILLYGLEARLHKALSSSWWHGNHQKSELSSHAQSQGFNLNLP